ncbi:hypothetical protein MTO96_024102 [Rhipicephalus appendiculatus]
MPCSFPDARSMTSQAAARPDYFHAVTYAAAAAPAAPPQAYLRLRGDPYSVGAICNSVRALRVREERLQ